MIIDLLKGNEYKEYRIVTWFKDAVLVLLFLICLAGITTGIISFINFENYFIIVNNNKAAWQGFRLLIVFSIIVAFGINSKSHKKEIDKLNKK